MGVNQSIQKKTHELEQAIDTKINRQAMIQREIQMSVSIAQARDSLMWFGSLYSLLITGLSTAFILKKPISKLAGIPVIIEFV